MYDGFFLSLLYPCVSHLSIPLWTEVQTCSEVPDAPLRQQVSFLSYFLKITCCKVNQVFTAGFLVDGSYRKPFQKANHILCDTDTIN